MRRQAQIIGAAAFAAAPFQGVDKPPNTVIAMKAPPPCNDLDRRFPRPCGATGKHGAIIMRGSPFIYRRAPARMMIARPVRKLVVAIRSFVPLEMLR